MGNKSDDKNKAVDDGKNFGISLEESLNRARVALDSSQKQMYTLHKAWRSQLQRITVMVLVVILIQVKTPISVCSQDIKDWNIKFKNDNDDESTLYIGFWDAVYYCFADSLMESMQILCCMSLIWLMYLPLNGDDFSSIPFRLAIAFVPIIISNYHCNSTLECLKNLQNSITDDNNVTTDSSPRPFPIMVIFLAIGLSPLFFMKYQQRQQDENIQKIDKLRANLVRKSKND